MNKTIYSTDNEDSLLKSVGPQLPSLAGLPTLGTKMPQKVYLNTNIIVTETLIFGEHPKKTDE